MQTHSPSICPSAQAQHHTASILPSEQPVLSDVRRIDRTRERAVVGDVARAREHRWSASALDPSWKSRQ